MELNTLKSDKPTEKPKDKNQKFFIVVIIVNVLLTLGILNTLRPKTSPTLTSHQSATIPTTPQKKLTTIFLGGDIMLSRNVIGKVYAADNFNLPFEKISDVTKQASIAFANLESPFNDEGDHSVEGSLVFNADPKAVAGLKFAGFDILSTANNHALDQGNKGINYTIDLLQKNNIIPTGTQRTTNSDPIEPVIKANDILYGFLSYSYTAFNDGGSTSPYVNDFNNLPKLKQDIVAMKGHLADVVIVNMHAGVEYTREPTQAQIDFAHAAIDAGADLVVGEHPHWTQTVEQYKGKWIIYSLGNLVFDQMFSTETREGLTALVTFDKNEIQKIELKPVIIDNFCCPRFANGEETKAILSKINLTSPVLSSTIK